MQFTDKENIIIADTEFLPLKLEVIEKIQKLFKETRNLLAAEINQSNFQFPIDVDLKFGKIFRGENYNSFPYVVLDYPKLFSKTNTFAFRTMFWWGNFFSTTLHIEGKYLDNLRTRIINNSDQILNNDVYICVNNSPWEYHYGEDNYTLFSEDKIKYLYDHNFIKLSKKYNLNQYKALPELSAKFLRTILNLLSE